MNDEKIYDMLSQLLTATESPTQDSDEIYRNPVGYAYEMVKGSTISEAVHAVKIWDAVRRSADAFLLDAHVHIIAQELKEDLPIESIAVALSVMLSRGLSEAMPGYEVVVRRNPAMLAPDSLGTGGMQFVPSVPHEPRGYDWSVFNEGGPRTFEEMVHHAHKANAVPALTGEEPEAEPVNRT